MNSFIPNLKNSIGETGESLIIEFLIREFLSNQTIDIFYIDIGCNHPKYINNTFHFYKKGKKGICIDSLNFKRLYKKIRPRDIFINKPISTNSKKVNFFKFDYLDSMKKDNLIYLQHGVSTTNIKTYKRYRKKFKLIFKKKIKPLTVSELKIYLKDKLTVPLLSIDVEGDEYIILKNFIKLNIKFGIICIEDKNINLINIKHSKIFKLLKSNSYIPICKTPENTIYINNKLKEFNFLPSKLLNKD